MEDLKTLSELCQFIEGRTVCAFGDAEISPVVSTLQHWRNEYVELIREAETIQGTKKEIPVLTMS
jgi:NADH-quinone oxidoreductase subunit F